MFDLSLDQIRSTNSEWIRKKVECEGVQARNIIKYNLPVDEHKPIEIGWKSSPRHAEDCRKSKKSPIFQVYDSINNGSTSFNPSRCMKGAQKPRTRQSEQFDLVSEQSEQSSLRVRSSRGAGEDYRARYWGQMLDTLKRTIDEIYSACELDESEVECKEVIMILKHSEQDFKSLIEKMTLLRRYEMTDAGNRPACLAWGERKISPGKPIMHHVLAETDSTLHCPISSATVSHENFSNVMSAPIMVHASVDSDRPRSIRSSPLSPAPIWEEYITSNSSSHALDEKALAWGSDEDLLEDEDEEQVDDDDEHIFGFDAGISEAEEEDEFDSLRETSGDKTRIDNEFSRDLRKLDKALETVKTAERALRSELGRAQSEEATLRRQVMAEEHAARRWIPPVSTSSSVPHSSKWLVGDLCISDWSCLSRPLPLRPQDSYNSQDSAQRRPLSPDQMRANLTSPVESEGNVSEDANEVEEHYDSEVNSVPDDDEEKGYPGRHSVEFLPCVSTASHSAVLLGCSNKPVGTSGRLSLRACSSVTRKNFNQKMSNQNVSRSSSRICYACSCATQQRRLNIAKPSKSTSRLSLLKSKQNPSPTTDFRRLETQKLSGTPANHICSQPLTAKISPYVHILSHSNDLDHENSIEGTGSIRASVSKAITTVSSVPMNHYPGSRITGSASVPVSVNTVSVNAGTDSIQHLRQSLHNNPSHLQAKNKPKDSNSVSKKSIGVGTEPLVETTFADGSPCPACHVGQNTKPRIPGRSIQMHEKLSSKQQTRKSSSIQQLEAKQARARNLRQRHLLERSNRVRELCKKVEEVRIHKRRLLQQRRSYLDERLHMAEQNRRAELDRRVLKAHGEEIKSREIAFIQTLEAEQKQHTIFAKHEISRARLEERAEERRRRLEEKTEKEEAAKLRRSQLEARRLAKLDALQARWVSRAQEMESRAEQTELMRRAAARAKEHLREVKLTNLENLQRVHIEELRSKIQRKQNDSERRHQETLRGIRRKALEMSAPTHNVDDTSTDMINLLELTTSLSAETTPVKIWCRVCKVLVDREILPKYHFLTKKHCRAILNSVPSAQRINFKMEAAQTTFQWLHPCEEKKSVEVLEFVEFSLLSVQNVGAAMQKIRDDLNEVSLVEIPENRVSPRILAELERQKMIGKRMVAIRERMNSRAATYRRGATILNPKDIPESTLKSQLQKLVKEARRYYTLPESGPWVASRVSAIEKVLHSLFRLLTGQKHSLPLADVKPTVTVNKTIQAICFHLDLLPILVGVIDLTRSQRYFNFPVIPARTISLVCSVLTLLCSHNVLSCWHLLLNNDLTLLVDCLIVKLTRLELTELCDNARISGTSQIGIPQPRALTLQNTVNAVHSLTNGLLKAVASPTTTGDSVLDDVMCVHSLLRCLITVMSVICLPKSCEQFLTTAFPLSASATATAGSKDGHQKQVKSVLSGQKPVSIHPAFNILDLVSYIGNSGLMELFTSRLCSPALTTELLKTKPKEAAAPNFKSDSPNGAPLAILIIDFLTVVVRLLPFVNVTRKSKRSERKNFKEDSTSTSKPVKSANVTSTITQGSFSEVPADDEGDPTFLMEAAAATEVFGLISLLYGLLLSPVGITNPGSLCSHRSGKQEIWETAENSLLTNSTTASDSDGSPTSLFEARLRSGVVSEIALYAIRLINYFVVANRCKMQEIISNDVTCVQLRHVFSCLLATCAPKDEEVLTEIVQPVTPQASVVQSLPSPLKNSSFNSAPSSDSGGCLSNMRSLRSVGRSQDGDVSSLLPSGARRIVASGDGVAKPTAVVYDEVQPLISIGSGDTKCRLSITALGSSKTSDRAPLLLSSLLHEVVICLGYLTVFHTANQTNLCHAGQLPTLLHRLIRLPVAYFSQRELADILFPTLICCCFHNPDNMALLRSELNPSLVANYIEARILECKMDTLGGSAEELSNSVGATAISDDSFCRLEKRFPKCRWREAKEFFQHSQD